MIEKIYNEADYRIKCNSLKSGEIVDKYWKYMKIQEIKFNSQDCKYSILIGKNALNKLPKKLKLLCSRTKNVALIIDKKSQLNLRKF